MKKVPAFLFVFISSLLLYFFAISKYGLAIFPDSINYLHAAQTLKSKFDFFQFTGEYFVSWPPLYSIIIRFFVIPFQSSAFPSDLRWLNAVILSLNQLLLFKIISSKFSNKLNLWVQILLVLGSWPIFITHFEVISESIFILFSLLLFHYLNKKVSTFNIFLLLSLCLLQRYIGVLWWIFLLIIIPQLSNKNQKRWLLGLLISGIPLAIWIVRNWFLTHHLTGVRSDAFISHFDNLLLGLDILSKWFLPHFIPESIRLIVIGLIFFVLFIQYLVTWNKYWFKRPFSFFSIYFIGIWLISSSGASEALSFRLLAPAYPFLLLSLIQFFSQTQSEKLRNVLFLLISVYQVLFLIRYSTDKMENGAGGFMTDAWQTSETGNWIAKHHQELRPIASNAADFYYLKTGKAIALFPYRYEKGKIDSLLPSKHHIIWFDEMKRKTLIPLDTLINIKSMKCIQTFEDGEIWEIQ